MNVSASRNLFKLFLPTSVGFGAIEGFGLILFSCQVLLSFAHLSAQKLMSFIESKINAALLNYILMKANFKAN